MYPYLTLSRIFISIFLIFICSCATKEIVSPPTPTQSNDFTSKLILSKSLKNPKPVSITPKSFELDPPSSHILRESLTIFEYGYDFLDSGNRIQDFITDNNIIAILSTNQILINTKSCPSINTDNKFNKIYLNGNFLAIYNYNAVEIYSISDCGRVGAYRRALSGDLKIIEDKVVEYESGRVILRDLHSGEQIASVDIELNIATAGIHQGKLSLIHENGFITYYDKTVNSFLISGELGIKFRSINFINNIFYGIDENLSFFTIIDNNIVNYDRRKCYVSSGSVSAICNNSLVYNNNIYSSIPNLGRFIAGKDVFLTANDANFKIYNLDQSYQKSIIFDYTIPPICITPKNVIYFRDFSDNRRKVVNKIESSTNLIPTSCTNKKSVFIKNGKFICYNNDCGDYAKPISTDNSTYLYKRMEYNKIYYYFEPN